MKEEIEKAIADAQSEVEEHFEAIETEYWGIASEFTETLKRLAQRVEDAVLKSTTRTVQQNCDINSGVMVGAIIRR